MTYTANLKQWYDETIDNDELERIEWHINRDATVRIPFYDSRDFLTRVLIRLTDAQEDRKALYVAYMAALAKQNQEEV